MIVWVASYPRSGNTFFRMLLYGRYGRKTHSLYDDPLFDRLGASDAVGHAPMPAAVEELRAREEIYFVKTHDLPEAADPAIYLVRDGRDALVSYARYTLSFRKATAVRKLKKLAGFDGFLPTLKELISSGRFGGWSGNVRAWTENREGPTAMIRFEDLLQGPMKLLDQAIDQLKVKLTAADHDSVPSFEELSRRWPQFFRRGKAGDWQEEMPQGLQQLFWQHHGETMTRLGYRPAGVS